MSVEFRAVPEPSESLLSSVSSLAPENPFYTPEYCRVMRSKGSSPVVLLLEANGKAVTACTAFSKKGRINHRLEIISAPAVGETDIFWRGLHKFCRDNEVSILSVHTFGSTETSIGRMDGEVSRKKRFEYQLDLRADDIWAGLHRRHQRHIKNASKNGLEIRLTTDPEAYRLHAELANLSLNRRRIGGDSIDYEVDARDLLLFKDNDVGELYQAVCGGEVFSSLLVLKSPAGAYAQTSGTSSKGRDCGASQLIFFEVACLLKAEGKTVFNLGGTDTKSSGLQDFKASFGARQFELEAAEFYFGGVMKKTICKVLEFIRLGK
ncbi:MAG: GNAT family N-acetyltransferase [Pyrinomonadaceae bacterium]